MCSEPAIRAPFSGLRLAELGPERHQPGHLGLGDLDLLAAEIGERDVPDDVVHVLDHVILAHARHSHGSWLRAPHSSRRAGSTTSGGRPETRMAITLEASAPAARRPGDRLRLRRGLRALRADGGRADRRRCIRARDFDICLCSDEPLAVPASLAHLGVRVCRVERPAGPSPGCGSTPGGPRWSTCGWRCRRPSPASTGGCSTTTPTSSCSRRRLRGADGRRPRRRTCSGRCATTPSGAAPGGGPSSSGGWGSGARPTSTPGCC